MSDQWKGRWTRHSPQGRWDVRERESGELICSLNKRPGGNKDFGDECGDLIEHAPELYEGCVKALALLRDIRASSLDMPRIAQVCEYLEYAIDYPPPTTGGFRLLSDAP